MSSTAVTELSVPGAPKSSNVSTACSELDASPGHESERLDELEIDEAVAGEDLPLGVVVVGRPRRLGDRESAGMDVPGSKEVFR